MSEVQREQARIGRLHILTDFFFQQRLSHADLARAAIAGGADTIQFRQKHGSIRHRLTEACRVAAVCSHRSVPLIIDDEIAIALSVGAAGVHLGTLDFPINAARKVVGRYALLGATATDAEGALRAESEGADYIGFGPVYATNSKSNPASVKGVRALSAVCHAVQIPVIGIAGITAERVDEVMDAGAWGVAVMSAITRSADPERATEEFRLRIDAMS